MIGGQDEEERFQDRTAYVLTTLGISDGLRGVGRVDDATNALALAAAFLD